MKKIIYIIICILAFFPSLIFASEKDLNIYLFYGDGCPHCAAEEKFLNEYLKKDKSVKLHKYEIWYDTENAKKYKEVNKILNDNSNSIPYLIIGNNTISGYVEDITDEEIKNTINFYKNKSYKDKVGIYLGVVDENSESKSNLKYNNNEINIPVIGKVDAKKVSISLSAIVIGLVDGFNPCAMWILIFLISMLIGMKNKKRMWALGITFLLSSALVYFLFLISWLNLAVFLNKIVYIRVAISAIAMALGVYQIVRFTSSVFNQKDDGCEVVDSKGRKKIIKSINKIVKEKSFILALLGVVLLAFSVNIIELLCSLGLPVMFSEILAVNSISKTGQVLYSLLYVFFFLIDDIVVFIIAMKTLEIKAISNKFGKYSHLIGGIIMLVIGLLIILKPEWLMFNF